MTQTRQDATEKDPYTRLTLFMVLMTVLTLAVCVASFFYIKHKMIHAAGENLARTAGEIADKVDRFLFERHGDIQMLAQTFSTLRYDWLTQSAHLASVQAVYGSYVWLGVTDSRGEIVAATDSEAVGQSVAGDPWFRELRNGRLVHVRNVEPSRFVSGKDVVTFAARINGREGEFRGVVIADVGLSEVEKVLTETLLEFQARDGTQAGVEYQFMTENGLAFIDSALADPGYVNLKELGVSSALLSERSLVGYVAEEHKRRHVPVITGYANTDSHGMFSKFNWVVLLRMNESDVIAPLRFVLWGASLLGVFLFGPILAVLHWSTKNARKEFLRAREESERARAANEALTREIEQHRLTENAWKHAEESVRHYEAVLSQAQSVTRIGTWELDFVTGRVKWSDEAYRIFERDQQAFQPSHQAFLESVHPDDAAKVHEAFSRSVESRKPLCVECRLLLPDGRVKYVLQQCEPLYDAQGVPVRFIGTIQDVTDRRQLEERLRIAQKMEAVGCLAGGIAHDFNNVLTVINSYADLALLQLGENDARLRRYVEPIKEAGLRASALTQQLLAFSRKQALNPVPLDLNRVITNYLTLLRPLIGEDITIVTHLETPLWTIHADQGQIEQVIMNLAVNARDAMPRGGRLVLETQNVDPYAPDALPSLSMKPGCYVSLVVRDSGCGMSAETKARIFDPFFTTKGKGKGTGLGLATVYGIVKQSGGEIWVDSEIGRGTSFRLFFPRAKEAPAPRRLQPDPARSDGLGGSETVLLVEDDDTVRALAKNTLARYGYHVLEARCGEEALEVLRRQSDPIHLLLTDIVMPGLDGRKLTERAVEMRPDIKVLMMSGYVDKPFPTSNGPDPRAAFLQKPFTPTGLARMVRSTLDAPHLPAAVAFT